VAEPAEVVPHDSSVEPPVPRIAAAVDLVASNENSAEPGLLTRKAVAVLGWISRKNLNCSLCGCDEFFEPQAFPFVAALEHNWTLIRGEVAGLMMR